MDGGCRASLRLRGFHDGKMFDTVQLYWPYILALLGAVIGIPAAIHAAMTKDDVRAAIGWVGIILLSPILGAAIYLVAGINRIRRSSIGNRKSRSEVQAVADEEPGVAFDGIPAEPRFKALKTLGDDVSPFWLTTGNRIEMLRSGNETYPAMIAAIEKAERSIALSSYIFDNDPAGRRVADALIAAAKRGVEVRVLIDAVGARYSRPSIVGRLREGGVPVKLFLGRIIGLRLPYANLRNHRKIMVVDGTVGFTGGMNIRQQFIADHATPEPHRDIHFRVNGPVVAQFLAVFADDWYFARRERLEGAAWRTGPFEEDGTSTARVIFSGPDTRLDATHAMIMGAAAVARHSIVIASPYFLPDLQIVGALAVAARRGVEVDIVIPAANNLRLVDYAMTAQLDQVIDPGCRVWRAAGTFDHSKLLTVDGTWSLVGSSNFDTRSLRLNFEFDMELFDPAFARRIEEHLRTRIASGEEETIATLRGRAFWKRLRNRVVWLASPYL